jgi:hypothetical protein
LFGTDGNEHDIGFIRMWTGAPLLSIAGHPWGGAASVDQIVARHFQTESMTLAVHASAIEPFPKPGFQHRRSFSYVAPGIHRVPMLDPFEVYTRFFAAQGELDAEAMQRLVMRRSVLDVTRGDLDRLRGRLGSVERMKLEAHEESIRAVENRLSDLMSGTKTPIALKPPRDYRNTQPALLVSEETAIPDIVASFIDLIAAGIASTTTRVATLQLGYAGAKWRFDWEGVSHDHHDLAHRDTTDEGVDPVVTDKLLRIQRWYAKQIASLAQSSTPFPKTAALCSITRSSHGRTNSVAAITRRRMCRSCSSAVRSEKESSWTTANSHFNVWAVAFFARWASRLRALVTYPIA